MTVYQINGMTCGNCLAKVQKAIADIPDAQATLKPPRLTLPDDATVDIEALNAKLSAVGHYSVSDVFAQSNVIAWLRIYQPLLMIIGYISAASFAGADDMHDWMRHFMAGFFLVFSFFKFLDIRGFADTYATYDLLAMRWHKYGYMYPVLELALGLAFLFNIAPVMTLLATIVLMGFSSLGVIAALKRKQKIRCACLGTVLNLPMSTITLVEDLGMVVMSLLMLLYI